MHALIVVLALAPSLAFGPQINRSRPFGPGRCGPIDPVYIRGATETGGQPFPMGPSEIARAAHIMVESSRSDHVTILWASGTAADAARGISIPVDSSIRRVTFSTTFDGTGGSVTVAAPDGRAIQQHPGTQDTMLNCGRILSVDAPPVGTWRVTLQPTGRFWLVVHGQSDLDVLSAQFVAVGGRPGHQGLFQISGQPITGRPAMLRVNLSLQGVETPRFVLVSTEGQRLRDVELTPAGDDEYVGTIDLPSVPFRVAVAWVDSAGVSYQRLHGSLFHAELVEVLPSDVETVTPGQATALVFVVRNFGPRARYRILATYGATVVNRVEPNEVEIEQGAEQRINVWLEVPPSVADGSDSTVTVVATSEGAPRATTNSVVQRLRVVKN